jgi:formiminoglutamate deiminase
VAKIFFDTALAPEGWRSRVLVATDGALIASVAAGTSPTQADERHAIGIPGMPNLHSHAFQRGMAGLAEVRGRSADTFWTWRETMYRFALAMTPEDVEAIAAEVYVEMLEAGFTRVGEFHYLHHDRDGRPFADPAEMAGRIAGAAMSAGIALTLLPVFYAHADFGGAPPQPGQRRFVCDLDFFARLLERSRDIVASLPGGNLGVAPHSLRAVTPGELSSVLAMSESGPVHIHAAEQTKEVADCLAWSGARPVAWLLEHAAVDGRWCLIHATHMTEAETTALAGSGATAGLCPVTEANLGDGIFDARRFVAAGGRYGVGSDSNVRIGVADELRQLEYAQRLRDRERNVLARHGASTGRSLFEAALCGGAAALGRPQPGLSPGAPADIVTLDAAHPALVGRAGDALLDAWLFVAGNEAVDSVWVAGRKLVSGGRHVGRAATRARYSASMRRLMA